MRKDSDNHSAYRGTGTRRSVLFGVSLAVSVVILLFAAVRLSGRGTVPAEDTIPPDEVTEETMETPKPDSKCESETGTSTTPSTTVAETTAQTAPSTTAKVGVTVSRSPSQTTTQKAVESTPVTTEKATSTAPKNLTPPTGINKELFNKINSERKNAGLSPLVYRSDLQKAADVRAVETVKTFAHTRPDGRSYYTVFSDLGLSTGLGAYRAEIVSATPDTRYFVSDTFDNWTSDAAHKSILKSSKYTGVVISTSSESSDGMKYCAALFVS